MNAINVSDRANIMHMLKQGCITAAVTWLVVGCTVNPIIPGEYRSTEIIDFPELGVEETRGLGDPLVSKGIRTIGPAIVIEEATTFGKEAGEGAILTCGTTVPAGSYWKAGVHKNPELNAECFGEVLGVLTDSGGAITMSCAGGRGLGYVCQDDQKRFMYAGDEGQIRYLEQQFDQIHRVDRVVERATNFKQELIYNGRVGSHIKFLYREFSGDFIRPAFFQEVQYDLSESSVIGFKRLRIEVIRATNSEIVYKVLANFQDPSSSNTY